MKKTKEEAELIINEILNTFQEALDEAYGEGEIFIEAITIPFRWMCYSYMKEQETGEETNVYSYLHIPHMCENPNSFILDYDYNDFPVFDVDGSVSSSSSPGDGGDTYSTENISVEKFKDIIFKYCTKGTLPFNLKDACVLED